jgi:sugar transport system substrate-binding protein
MRHLTTAAAVGAACVALAACGSNSTDGDEAASGSGAPTSVTIGMTELFPTGYFADFERGLEEEAQAQGVELDLISQNVNNDAGQESQAFQTFVTRKVDAILATAVSPTGSVAAFKQAAAAEIPVVCYNTCLSPEDTEQYTKSFVSSNSVELGRLTGEQAATYIKDELGGSATAVMLTCETYDVCKDRRKGLDEALASVDLDIVAEQEGFVVDKATPVAKAMLAAHPDVDIFLAENEDANVAAVTAVKSRGLQDKVAVFGIGIDPKIAALVASPDGILRFTTGQDPYNQGKIALRNVLDVLAGKTIDPRLQYSPSPTFAHAEPEKARSYIEGERDF